MWPWLLYCEIHLVCFSALLQILTFGAYGPAGFQLYNAQIALPVITQSSNTDIPLLSIILYTFFL